MANIQSPGPSIKLLTGFTSGNYIIGTGSDASPSAFAVEIVNTSSLVVTIDVKARINTNEATARDNIAFVKSLYGALWLNGAIGDGTIISTQITDTSMILVPATGLEVSLEIVYTSGTGAIYKKPIIGPSVF